MDSCLRLSFRTGERRVLAWGGTGSHCANEPKHALILGPVSSKPPPHLPAQHQCLEQRNPVCSGLSSTGWGERTDRAASSRSRAWGEEGPPNTNLILQDKEKRESQTIQFQFCVIRGWIILIWPSLSFLPRP